MRRIFLLLAATLLLSAGARATSPDGETLPDLRILQTSQALPAPALADERLTLHFGENEYLPIERPERPLGGPQNVLGEMRVDDGTGALVFPGWCSIGICGASNRFDPMDAWDADGSIPSPSLRILRIHFLVNGSEPPGPMDWYVWEDNGGHKPDDTRILEGPITVTGQPGENIIDLEAMGRVVTIDPARMFQVGIRDAVTGTTPVLVLDDGLPYVGGTGDFHGSYYFNDTQFCPGWKWALLSVQGPGGAGDSRSPAWMIWLEVDFDTPPPTTMFTDVSGTAGAGSRLAWGDYNGDGWEDLLISGSTLYESNANPPDVTFTNVTASTGIPSGGNGGIFGDYDNDGDPDIYQMSGACEPCQNSSFRMDRLLRNEGDGTFTDVLMEEYGGDRNAPVPHDVLPTEGAAWGDFNNDGWLDLYAANHVDWDTGECWQDYLWINQGPPDFSFLDATAASGILNETIQCGRGVAPADFDGDGDLDIFVSNYRLTPDLLWVNSGMDNRDIPLFTEEAEARGVKGTDQLGAEAYGHGIGAGWGDMDRDGDQDLIVGNLAHSGWRCFSDITAVFESTGGTDAMFNDIAPAAGIEYNEVHSDASFADWDNDGFLDLFISGVYDGWRNQIYRSLGTVPSTFEQVTHLSGIYGRSGWGTAWADYDQDGDLDLATRQFYRNNLSGTSPNHWLQVELEGTRSNRDAIGAKVFLTHGVTQQMREVHGARGTASQDSRVVHFGLGPDTIVDILTVEFPSGCTVQMNGVAADQRLPIQEPECLVARFTTPGAPGGRLACAGLQVSFQDASQGTATEWNWDFDGDTVFDVTGDPAPQWTYATPGLYQVTLEVSDGVEISTYTAGVLVTDVPEDPGISLMGDTAGTAVSSWEWSGTTVIPPAGGDYVLTRADDAQGPWTEISPRGLISTSYEDASAPAQSLTFYLLSVRATDDCWSVDPYRP